MMAVILHFYFSISLDWVYISTTRLKIIFLSQYRQFSFSVFSSLCFWCNIFCQADSLSIVFWKYKAICIFFPLDTFSLSIMKFHNNGCRSSGFPGGSVEKICLPMQETWAQSLGQEDLLEKEMAIHFSILAWEIPWTEEPGKLQSMGVTDLDTTEGLSRHMHL